MSRQSARVIKAGLAYTIGNVLIRGLSFLTLPIFTRLMSPSDYGLYSVFITYESLLSLVIGLGLHASLKAANVEFKDQIDAYVSSVSLLPILFALLWVSVAVAFRHNLGRVLGFNGSFAVLMICQGTATAVISMYNSRISLQYAYKKYLVIALVSSALNIGLSLFLIIGVRGITPFQGRILGTSIPVTVISVFLLISFFRKAKPSLDKKFVVFGLKYSLPLVPHGVSQIILAQFGKIIIQQKIGNDAAGIYGFAYTIALIPQILVTSLDTAWGPWFFERYEKGYYDEIKKRSTQYVVLFSSITCILFCVSPEIVRLLASEAYWPSINLVVPAILGVYFTFMYTLPAQVEYYHRKTKYIAMGTVIAALFNIILCVQLVPIYGYGIVVFVTVVTYIFYFVAHLLIALRIVKNQLPFDLQKIVAYALFVCGMAVIMRVFVSYWPIRYAIICLWIIVHYLINRDAVHGIIRKFRS